MEQLIPRYAHAYAPGKGVTFVAVGGCFPVPGVGRRQGASPCERWINEAYRFAQTAGYRHVIVGSMWTGYFDPEPGESIGILCFDEGRGCVTSSAPAPYRALIDHAFDRFGAELATLRRAGMDVAVIEPFPQGPEADPRTLYKNAFFHHVAEASAIDRRTFLDRTAFPRGEIERAARTAGVRLIDPSAALCPKDVCPVKQGSKARYIDDSHFRASVVVGPDFAFLDKWVLPQ
jgi:hypothetical protein